MPDRFVRDDSPIECWYGSDPLVAGIPIPPKHGNGRMPPRIRLLWIDCVQQLMERGVTSGARIRDLTGLTAVTARTLVKEVMEGSVAPAVDGRFRAGRLRQLVDRLDMIYNTSMRRAYEEGTADKLKVAYLGKALGALQQQARVLGLDQLAVNVMHETVVVDAVELARSRFGLDAAQLADLGRAAAQNLSLTDAGDHGHEPAVVELEPAVGKGLDPKIVRHQRRGGGEPQSPEAETQLHFSGEGWDTQPRP